MSEFSDALDEMFADAREIFGEESVTFEDVGAVLVNWNALDTREELEIHGRIVGFTAVAEVAKDAWPDGEDPPSLSQQVTRDGVTYYIVGEIAEDQLTWRLTLDSRDAEQ